MNNGRLNMSIPDLLRIAASGVNYARRDIDIMTTYGINEESISMLEADRDLLKETPTDEELQEVLSELTRSKDLKGEIVRASIRSFIVRAKNVFGADSPEVRGFNSSELSRLSDNELMRAGRAVKRMSVRKLDILSLKGLTQQMIDEFSAQVEAFDNSIDDIIEGESTHREGTAARHKLALKVYNQVAEIFDYGKNHWRGKNDLKYADYVIFDVPAPKKHKAGSGTLCGNVTNVATTGRITNALIELLGTTIKATTDADGNYLIEEAPAATCTLKCSATGMTPAIKEKIIVTDGNLTNCDFGLSAE